MSRFQKLFLFGCLVLVVVVLGWWAIARAEQLIASTGAFSSFVYVLLIITEVVIAPIPGGVLALLGAAHFGFVMGWALNYVGNVVGASIAFLLARRFGQPLVHRLVKAKDRLRYESLVQRHPFVLYLVYAIPFFPIDILSLLLGVSVLSYRRFLLITALGLVTYSGFLAYIGSRYVSLIPFVEQVSVIAVIVLVVGFLVWVFYEFVYLSWVT
ncbi:MAG: TVP38/TMEM64 family protein [Candidatus Woesearchaeota archaeon]